MINGELIVDNFAGGGGASTGIEMATGYSVDIAINHDPEAIRMHMTNHPNTKHYCEDVWQVDPVKVCAGHPVGLAWFSPDCKHFSKAKGGKPKGQIYPWTCLGGMQMGRAGETTGYYAGKRRGI
ncbi:MAG: hypothetical protein ACLR6B_08975 [Blautia sp.]